MCSQKLNFYTGAFKGRFRAPWGLIKNPAPLASTGDLDLKIARNFFTGANIQLYINIHHFFFVPVFSIAFFIWSEIAAALFLMAFDFSLAAV